MTETVLVLSPHTDDAELGCGGTISKFLEDGYRIVYVAFSAAEESVPAHLSSNILRIESRKATDFLGLSSEDCIIYNFKVRKFPEYRQEILEKMVELKKCYEPQIVLLPASSDIHQDHKTITEEGIRGFKYSTLLGYELPWNHTFTTTNCFIEISQHHLKKKLGALRMYQSQSMRSYMSEDYIVSLARVRGQQIGQEYAESFEVLKWVIV